MSHSIVQSGDMPFVERPYRPQDESRQVASLTEALGLENARASVWRYPPGARGRRHREGAQEEVFAVLEGTITLALGEPPEMVVIPAGGFARVGTGTEIQVRNESDADAVVLAWGRRPSPARPRSSTTFRSRGRGAGRRRPTRGIATMAAAR